MKERVTDAQVAEYAARVRAGDSTEDVFPARMSDCEFSPGQREIIKQARAERKAAVKNGKLEGPNGVVKTKEDLKAAALTGEIKEPAAKARSISKLGRILYLQCGRCFFCGEVLGPGEASIEHLDPKSAGGASTEDNEVVCHKSLNEAFGSMGLKAKFAFVLRSAGAFKCPKR